MWNFWGKVKFPHGFGQIAQNYVETVPSHKISTPRNSVKLWYFTYCDQWLQVSLGLENDHMTQAVESIFHTYLTMRLYIFGKLYTREIITKMFQTVDISPTSLFCLKIYSYHYWFYSKFLCCVYWQYLQVKQFR